MTKMKKIICGILLLSFCLSSVSCKKKKEVFTHESIISAAKSYGDETNARTSWVFIEKRT